MTVRFAPTVRNVTLKLLVPEIRAASAGSTALESLDVMWIVSLVLITFQLASTPFTVTVKTTLELWMIDVPVLPDPVPGAAVSPGTSNWSLVNDPALMVNEVLVAPFKPVPIPEAEAVMV